MGKSFISLPVVSLAWGKDIRKYPCLSAVDFAAQHLEAGIMSLGWLYKTVWSILWKSSFHCYEYFVKQPHISLLYRYVRFGWLLLNTDMLSAIYLSSCYFLLLSRLPSLVVAQSVQASLWNTPDRRQSDLSQTFTNGQTLPLSWNSWDSTAYLDPTENLINLWGCSFDYSLNQYNILLKSLYMNFSGEGYIRLSKE
jgi:hypothetical protein